VAADPCQQQQCRAADLGSPHCLVGFAPRLWVTQRAVGAADSHATGKASWKEAAAGAGGLQREHLNTVPCRTTALACVVGAGWRWLGAAAPSPGSAAAPATTAQQKGLCEEEEVHGELLGPGSNRGAGGLWDRRGGTEEGRSARWGGRDCEGESGPGGVQGTWQEGCLQECRCFGVVAHGV